jgi:hypothetical protein
MVDGGGSEVLALAPNRIMHIRRQEYALHRMPGGIGVGFAATYHRAKIIVRQATHLSPT